MPDPIAFLPADQGSAEGGLPIETKPGRGNPKAYARAVVLAISQIVAGKTSSIAVDKDHPVPTAARGYKSSTAIVPGTDGVPGRAVHVVCTTAGNVVLKLADDSSITMPVVVGAQVLNFEAKTVVVAGTTAVHTSRNLY